MQVLNEHVCDVTYNIIQFDALRVKPRQRVIQYLHFATICVLKRLLFFSSAIVDVDLFVVVLFVQQ